MKCGLSFLSKNAMNNHVISSEADKGINRPISVRKRHTVNMYMQIQQ